MNVGAVLNGVATSASGVVVPGSMLSANRMRNMMDLAVKRLKRRRDFTRRRQRCGTTVSRRHRSALQS